MHIGQSGRPAPLVPRAPSLAGEKIQRSSSSLRRAHRTFGSYDEREGVSSSGVRSRDIFTVRNSVVGVASERDREKEDGKRQRERERERANVSRIARASKVTSHLPIQDGRRPAGGWSEEDHHQRENTEGEADRGDRGECDDKGCKCDDERRFFPMPFDGVIAALVAPR